MSCGCALGAASAYPTACDAALQMNPSAYAGIHPLWVVTYVNGDDAAKQLVKHDCELAAAGAPATVQAAQTQRHSQTALWITSTVAALAVVALAVQWRK